MTKNKKIVTYTTAEQKQQLNNIQQQLKQEYNINLSESTLTSLAIKLLTELPTRKIIQAYNLYVQIE